MIKAAQYIRMSTDRQDLSPAIQKEAIARYADANGIDVEVSYEDLGRSGVRLANRPGLTRLLSDVTAQPCFSVVLVYDVSRWGRFQDADASAYYDYHCRLNGVSVIYVAENFGEGISPVSTLVKGMKRLMAAEYSRDLAFKCVAGQEHVLAMGFQMGHPPCLGYRRASVSADGLRLALLMPGQRKLALTDRIHWVLAGDEEVALVREIFDTYARTGCTVRGLVRRALTQGWVNECGQPLTKAMLGTLLRCEAVIGNFVWGRTHHQSHFRIAKMMFQRLEGAVPRIVDDSTWALVQAKLSSVGWNHRSSDDLLRQLKLALERNPSLTTSELAAHGCAAKGTYSSHFGSWQAALEATGIEPTLLAQNGFERSRERRAAGYIYGCALSDALFDRGVPARFSGRFNVLMVRRSCVRIRFLWPKVRAGGRSLWHVEGFQSTPEAGRVLFIRMEANGIPIDFFLVETAQLASAFPHWLARQVPTDLDGYWIPSRPLLLKRLGHLWSCDAPVARERDNFNGLALTRHRHRLGLTARDCGALIGVTPQSVYRWEKGNSWPCGSHLEAIAGFQRLGKKEAAIRLMALIR